MGNNEICVKISRRYDMISYNSPNSTALATVSEGYSLIQSLNASI
jgi:hypothetical protein